MLNLANDVNGVIEVKLPLDVLCNILLNSNPLMSGYHHEFKIEKSDLNIINLRLYYSRHQKPEKILRSSIYINLIKVDLSTTVVQVKTYPLIFWIFWLLFFGGLYILPIINTPQLPYFMVFVMFLLIGGWTVRTTNQINAYFVYHILSPLIDENKLSWLGNHKNHPTQSQFMSNSYLSNEIRSLHSIDAMINLIESSQKELVTKRTNKLLVHQDGDHLVLLQYTKNKSQYQLSHRFMISSLHSNHNTLIKIDSIIEPMLLSNSVLAGVVGLIFASLT